VQKQVPAQSRGVSHYRRTLAASQRGRGLHLFTLNPEGEPAQILGAVGKQSEDDKKTPAGMTRGPPPYEIIPLPEGRLNGPRLWVACGVFVGFIL